MIDNPILICYVGVILGLLFITVILFGILVHVSKLVKAMNTEVNNITGQDLVDPKPKRYEPDPDDVEPEVKPENEPEEKQDETTGNPV